MESRRECTGRRLLLLQIVNPNEIMSFVVFNLTILT